MGYRTITYDEQYEISDTEQDVFSYANDLAGQDVIPVSMRTFDATFKPSQLTVNGRSGRRVGCIIAEDQMRYKVFDIDLEDEDEEEEEVGEESMEMDQETETYG
jgi:anaphase-promoting complex subunit 4